MLALRSSPPVFSVAEAERAALESYGFVVSAQALSGEREANFRLTLTGGREFTLKFFDAATPAGTSACHVRVLQHLAVTQSSLPVPRVIPTQQGEALGSVERGGLRYPICLLSYLPGDLLSARPLGASQADALGAAIAQLDRALQRFVDPALHRPLAWDLRRLPELQEFRVLIEDEPTRERVRRVALTLTDRMPALSRLPAQAIHGDIHGGNLLAGPQGAGVGGILDFGDMLHAPVVFELAVCLSELLICAHSADAPAALITGYARHYPLEFADVEVLFDLVTARHALTILIHAWRVRYDASGAGLLDTMVAQAIESLAVLLERGAASCSAEWHAAAGTAPPNAGLLRRRRRALGAGAELFYDAPLHLVRGRDVWLYDVEGRAYLDAYNNVPHVGHTHPSVVAAIQRQTALLCTHTRYLGEAIIEYAEALKARLPAHLDCCIFVNSGSEANDVAWRMARFATGHEGALIMAHAYHGITDAVAALTPAARFPEAHHVVTLSPPTDPANTAADTALGIATLAARGHAPAAFYLDTGITSSGIYDPPPAWAQTVVAGIRAAGGLIVADEVQYGLGRSGSHFWGFERRGFVPDIVTMGKPVGNGYPMGVVVAGRSLVEAFQARHGFFSTFGGNAVAAAAGLAVLRVLDEEGLPENARRTGSYLRDRLSDLATRHACVGSVRGAGLLLGVDIVGPDEHSTRLRTKAIINHMAEQSRVLISCEGPRGSILKLRPPMPFRPEHADMLTSALEAAVRASAD